MLFWLVFASYTTYDETRHCHAAICPADHTPYRCDRSVTFGKKQGGHGYDAYTCREAPQLRHTCYDETGKTRGFYRRTVLDHNRSHMQCLPKRAESVWPNNVHPEYVWSPGTYLWNELGFLVVPMTLFIWFVFREVMPSGFWAVVPLNKIE